MIKQRPQRRSILKRSSAGFFSLPPREKTSLTFGKLEVIDASDEIDDEESGGENTDAGGSEEKGNAETRESRVFSTSSTTEVVEDVVKTRNSRIPGNDGSREDEDAERSEGHTDDADGDESLEGASGDAPARDFTITPRPVTATHLDLASDEIHLMSIADIYRQKFSEIKFRFDNNSLDKGPPLGPKEKEVMVHRVDAMIRNTAPRGGLHRESCPPSDPEMKAKSVTRDRSRPSSRADGRSSSQQSYPPSPSSLFARDPSGLDLKARIAARPQTSLDLLARVDIRPPSRSYTKQQDEEHAKLLEEQARLQAEQPGQQLIQLQEESSFDGECQDEEQSGDSEERSCTSSEPQDDQDGRLSRAQSCLPNRQQGTMVKSRRHTAPKRRNRRGSKHSPRGRITSADAQTRTTPSITRSLIQSEDGSTVSPTPARPSSSMRARTPTFRITSDSRVSSAVRRTGGQLHPANFDNLSPDLVMQNMSSMGRPALVVTPDNRAKLLRRLSSRRFFAQKQLQEPQLVSNFPVEATASVYEIRHEKNIELHEAWVDDLRAMALGYKPTVDYRLGPLIRSVAKPRYKLLFLKSGIYEPMQLFRKSVKRVLLMMRLCALARQDGQLNETKNLSFAQYQHELLKAQRTVYGNGLSFDPYIFKAQKEQTVPTDVRTILSLDAHTRTAEQLHSVLISLQQCVDAFSEFPIKMQKALVRVGWYEFFESKRIIIRQGHTAENFYFILSGTAVVTILDRDAHSGEEHLRTAAVLGRGNSFGELALMNAATRSATVTCKDNVELLAVARPDFVDIFMHLEKDKEPEHISFLRTVDMIDGWPVDVLPWDNPKICLLTYFRRGVVMCRDSNNADWIYVVKSGSCRVLKDLLATSPSVRGLAPVPYKNKSDMDDKSTFVSLLRLRKGQAEDQAVESGTNNESTFLKLHDLMTPRPQPTTHDKYRGLPPISVRRSTESVAIAAEENEEHKRILDEIYRNKHPDQEEWRSRKHREENAEKPENVYVKIRKLTEKETFGLEAVVFNMQIERNSSFSLVSNGAEAILINRKFFIQHLGDEMRKKLRTTIQAYPSEESLQSKLQVKSNWDAYKSLAIADQIVYSKFVHDTLHF